MRIAAQYSFKNGLEKVLENYPLLLDEIKTCIGNIDAEESKTSKSNGKTFYSPVGLENSFKKELLPNGWSNLKVDNREMDFVKERLGVDVQFDKDSSMVYSGCAKMTIFHNLDLIDYGIEIVPVKSLSAEMSSGVSYFEQFVWDLENRGVADIDIPVLIIGIDA